MITYLKQLLKKIYNWGFSPVIIIFIGAITVALTAGAHEYAWIARTGAVIVALGGVWAAICNDRLHEYVTKYLSGGDSFCYLRPTSSALEQDMQEPDNVIIHVGKYPLYDVCMIITDLQEMKIRMQRGPLSLDDFEQGRVGTMAPNQVINNYIKLYLPTEKEATNRDYNIQFNARNGWWIQNLRFRRVDEKWAFATRIVALDEQRKNEVLYEDVPASFPLNDEGAVEW